LILWLVAFTINALINAANEVCEKRLGFTGVSIQGYLEIVKILMIIVGIILNTSLIPDESVVVSLTGIGALTEALLLSFQDAILLLIVSIRISTPVLVKEGEWL
jgi:miniconductance mechanosensitive channel